VAQGMQRAAIRTRIRDRSARAVRRVPCAQVMRAHAQVALNEEKGHTNRPVGRISGASLKIMWLSKRQQMMTPHKLHRQPKTCLPRLACRVAPAASRWESHPFGRMSLRLILVSRPMGFAVIQVLLAKAMGLPSWLT